MENSYPTLRSAQSPEITDAFQQYTKYIGKCWEKTVGIFRREVLNKGYKLGKRCKGGFNLERVCNNEFFKAIDSKHPERAIDALKFIQSHPPVITKPYYHGVSFIEEMTELPSGEYAILFTSAVIRHYLAEDLSVEYDESLVNSFKSQSASILYKKGCMLANCVAGFFDMSEEDLRLIFSIDTIEKKDAENLKKQRIRDINKLPIQHSSEYERFDHFISRIIVPGLAEINKAYEDCLCPFMLTKEIVVSKVRTGKRGKPKQKNNLRIFIVDPSNEGYTDPQNEDIEYADAEEIIDNHIHEENRNNLSGFQTEISFSKEDISQKQKLQKIESDLYKILNNSKAAHKEAYVRIIIEQIRKRYELQPTIIDATLAWIEYSENKINEDKKDDKYIAYHISRFLQSNLETYLHLVYEGKSKQGEKERLKWNGSDPIVFPKTINPDFFNNKIKIIVNNGNNDTNQDRTEHQLAPSAAESIRKRFMQKSNSLFG